MSLSARRLLVTTLVVFSSLVYTGNSQKDLILFFPYLASIQLHGKHACSGTLVTKDWLVTAAHCVEGQLESWMSVRVGSSSQYEGGKVLQVDEIDIHPRYNPRTLDCNIALIKAKVAEPNNSTLTPIALASYHRYGGWKMEQNTPMLAVGWPPDVMLSTRRVHFYGARLRAIGVTSVDHGKCDKEYIPYGGLTERMFCVQTNSPTDSLCNGDGGAPLIVSHTLVGLISHGLGCLWPGVPTVATNIPYFNSWIRSTTGMLK